MNALLMVGAATTVRVAVLLAEPAAGVWVVVTPELVLLLPPSVLLVTLKVTVQLPLAGMVIPEKLSDVWPAVNEVGIVPAQVPPTAPAAALMLTSVSVKVPPVRAEALLLERVRVTRELPPDGIAAGLNAWVIVGATRLITVRVAVLLAGPVIDVCVVATVATTVEGVVPATNGEPGMAVSAPVAGSMLYAETLLEVSFAT